MGHRGKLRKLTNESSRWWLVTGNRIDSEIREFWLSRITSVQHWLDGTKAGETLVWSVVSFRAASAAARREVQYSDVRVFTDS